MTFPQFDEFFDALITECRYMRDTKGKEYAHSTSRFANFDRASERLGISREMVANVYLHKHLDAIDSYILHREEYSGENIRGRIVDAITYLTLIAGMIENVSYIGPPSAEPPLLKSGTELFGGKMNIRTATPLCDSQSPRNFKCTLPKGHLGSHVARVSSTSPTVDRWCDSVPL